MPPPRTPDTVRPAATIESHLLQRGLFEVRPRRVMMAKVAATVLRQVARGGKPGRVHVLEEPSTSEPEALYGYLADVPDITLTAPHVGTLLAAFSSVQEATTFAVLGGCQLPPPEGHEAMSRSLVGYRAEWQNDLLRRLDARLADALKEKRDFFTRRRDSICYQEKPGRTSVFDLWEPTAKAVAKRWQGALAQGEKDVPRPLEVGAGFGVAAFSVDPLRGAGRFAAMETRLPVTTFDLDTAPRLASTIEEFCRTEAGLELGALRRIYLSIPSIAVTAYLEARLIEASKGGLSTERFEYPDLLWGWHPTVTAAEFLTSPVRPALLIHTGGFPRIDIALLTEAGA